MITEVPVSQTIQYSIKDAIRESCRETTINDTWCSFQYSPGLIYTIPYGHSVDLSWLNGYIIRTKKIGDNFLIQVVSSEKKNQKYYVRCLRIETFKVVNGEKRVVYQHLVNIKSRKKHR